MGQLAKKIKESSYLGRELYYIVLAIYSALINRGRSDRYLIRKKYKRVFGRYPDLSNPKLLTEWIQYLKLTDRNPQHTILVDKYAVREFIEQRFGKEYVIPLIFETTKADDIGPEHISEYPCIVKSNHDSGNYRIIRAPEDVDWKALRIDCKHWLRRQYYYCSQEWPYKNITPHRIVVEKLLQTREGKIPNDYKLHYINGELQFVYVSFDREGVNDRCTYDAEWNRLPLVWVPKESYRPDMNTSDVPCPKSFEKMKEFGAAVAKDFKYVRVDFYDVDGKLYFGEITLFHGSGFDVFFPEKYDLIFGIKIDTKTCVKHLGKPHKLNNELA